MANELLGAWKRSIPLNAPTRSAMPGVVLAPHIADLTPSAESSMVAHCAGVFLRMLESEELIGISYRPRDP